MIVLRRQYVLVLFISLVLITPFLGCTENIDDSNSADKEKNDDVKTEELTDEDWEYYVWQYTTRNQLFDKIQTGWEIINSTTDKHIRLFILRNDSVEDISKLNNISLTIKKNVTSHLNNISNFNLSNRLEEIRGNQIIILNSYYNISKSYSSIYNKYIKRLKDHDESIQKTEYVDMSDQINEIIENSKSIQTQINTINTKLNNSISENEYFKWVEGKNTSILEF